MHHPSYFPCNGLQIADVIGHEDGRVRVVGRRRPAGAHGRDASIALRRAERDDRGQSRVTNSPPLLRFIPGDIVTQSRFSGVYFPVSFPTM